MPQCGCGEHEHDDGQSGDHAEHRPLSGPLSLGGDALGLLMVAALGDVLDEFVLQGQVGCLGLREPPYGLRQVHAREWFTADPVELRKWVITDGAGAQTTVILQDFATGLSLSDALFNTTTVGERQNR